MFHFFKRKLKKKEEIGTGMRRAILCPELNKNNKVDKRTESLYSCTIKKFLLGKITTNEGYYIDDILNFTPYEFEAKHQFIQWLFPIDTKSPYNPFAPTLSKEEAAKLGEDIKIRKVIISAFQFACKMYGLKVLNQNGNISVTKSDDFDGYWIFPNSHNYLRITRILTCLSSMGTCESGYELKLYSRAFLAYLEKLAKDFPGKIPTSTLQYWQNAVNLE